MVELLCTLQILTGGHVFLRKSQPLSFENAENIKTISTFFKGSVN